MPSIDLSHHVYSRLSELAAAFGQSPDEHADDILCEYLDGEGLLLLGILAEKRAARTPVHTGLRVLKPVT